MDSQLGNLVANIPRPQGKLPGHPDENPKGYIAAVTLRNGRELPDLQWKMKGKAVQDSPKEPTEPIEASTEPVVIPQIIPPPRPDPTEPVAEASSCAAAASRGASLDPLNLAGPKLPFPPRKNKDQTEKKYKRFVELLISLKLNIPFTEALSEMPAYNKFLKEILFNKRSLPDWVNECRSLSLTNECSALIQNRLP